MEKCEEILQTCVTNINSKASNIKSITNDIVLLKKSFESDKLNWSLIKDTITCRNKEFYTMGKEELKSYAEHLYDLEPTETDLNLFEQLISYENSKENISYIENLLKLIDEDLKVLNSKYKNFQENISAVNYELKNHIQTFLKTVNQKII